MSDSATTMDISTEKVDEAVIGLPYLDLYETDRFWKSFDLERLHVKRYITSPISKAKPVIFTEESLKESERLFTKLFTRKPRLYVP